MGLADLFRPKWRHSNPEVRAEAVRQLGEDQTDLLAAILRDDADVRVRRVALKKVDDPELLRERAARDPDEALRKAAAERAEELLLASANAGDLDALERLGSPRLLATVAQKAASFESREQALLRLCQTDQKAAAEVLRKVSDLELRKRVVPLLHEVAALRELAIAEGSKEVALLAVARLEDRAGLEKVAHKAKVKAVRQAARDKMPPAPKAEESPEAQRRARLLVLVRAVEQATEPGEVEAARARFASEGAEDELRRRFDRACERFYARRAAAAKKAPTAPRPSIAPPMDDAARLAEERAQEEAARRREEEQRRREEEQRRREEEQRRREEEQRRREEEQRRREEERAAVRARRQVEEEAKRARLEALTVELEAIVVEEAKRGAEQLKKAQQAFDALGRLPRDADKTRWQAARDRLRARVNELYEAENWKRWANLPKLEALCARAESLLEETDGKRVAAELKLLQAEWKASGPATKEKQEQLWQRFKTATDQLHERSRAYFATLDEQRAANLAKKEELAGRVEALVERTDWKETAELIKALQAEWKATGPVAKEDADRVWKRFRGACDQFFARRQAHFAASDAQRQANLAHFEELIAAAEGLAAAVDEKTNWKQASAEIKRLQAEWKGTGPAPRDQAEEAWKRFRGACDRFFAARQEYFAKLDEERAANLRQKALLCEKVEALAEAPDLKEALAVVQQLQAEWKTVGPAPKDESDAVWRRFRAACDRMYARARQPEPAASEAPSQGYSAPKLGDLLKR